MKRWHVNITLDELPLPLARHKVDVLGSSIGVAVSRALSAIKHKIKGRRIHNAQITVVQLMDYSKRGAKRK